ncbi:MAG: T9SS type A sorting domain-containing protein [Bacteroidales bacterium]|nr:T9SS type A sorting domain-containing protein [Bacteroidales bacterium]
MKRIFTSILLLSTNLVGFSQTNLAEGYAFLENQTYHTGISVTFERQAPSSLTYTVTTDEAGYFSEDVEDGIYIVIYEKDNYIGITSEGNEIYTNIQLEDVTLEAVGLSGNLFGTLSAGTYTVTGDITVPEGQSLIIEPGTILLFKQNIKLTAEGELSANGTEADSIIFTRYEDGVTWGGIELNDEGNSQISYSRVEYSVDRGINIFDYSYKKYFGNKENTGNIIVRNSVLRNNETGIRVRLASAFLYNLTIYNNQITGIAVNGGAGGGLKETLHISNCNIYNNSTPAGNGGIYVTMLEDNFYTHILNCNIYSNNCNIGAITIDGTIPYLSNNNIVNNNSYGVHISDYSWSLEDCSYIGYNNVNDNSLGNYHNPPEYVGEIITTNQNGDPCDAFHNIQTDPMFANANNYDFHLLEGSPCIDAGLNDSVYIDFDFDYNMRIWDGNNDENDVVDIGAFEYGAPVYTNIKNLKKNIHGIYAYPNPTSGIINFVPSNYNIHQLIISDITGKILIKKTTMQQNETIDLSSFESGIYIIRIYTDKKIFTTKIVKR